MMTAHTVYDHIARNNAKTFFLVLLFPVTLCLLMYAGIYLALNISQNGVPVPIAEINGLFFSIAPLVIGGALVWIGISYFFGDQMMLGFAGAQELTPDSKMEKCVRRAVENVALAAGLPTPRVYVIEDDSLNAFATGRTPATASVAVTRGLVNTLEPLELEAVIAHEIGHIGNRDIRLNMMIITGIGIFGLLADMFYPSRRSSNDKDGAVLWGIWLAFVVFSFLVAPLIQFAVSRTREYAADATAAFITRNPTALASALRKISRDARVETLDKAPHMAAACIESPLAADENLAFLGLGKTHPDVEDRIARLEQMATVPAFTL